MLVEADGLRPALVAAVAILHLPIAAGDCIGCAEDAFDVGAGHSGVNLPAYHRIAPGATRDAVSASVVLFAYDGERLHCSVLESLALRSWLGQGYGFARAWRWVKRLLNLGGLIRWTTLPGEREVACFIDAAVNACSERWSAAENQGATARGE